MQPDIVTPTGAWPWPERFSCDGDEYHDVMSGEFVVGARPCLGCPSCQPEKADAHTGKP